MPQKMLLSLLTISLLSCAKESLHVTPDNLIGSWDLVEICSSPGDTSLICDAPTFTESFVFNIDNSYALTSDGEDCSGTYRYTVTDQAEELGFISTSGSCERTSATYIILVSDADSLHLNNVDCIEPCIWKYGRK